MCHRFFNQECQKFVPKSGEAWPIGRVEHAACCLGFGERPQLLLIGGLYEGNKTLNDIWILDLESMKWREVHTLDIFWGLNYSSSTQSCQILACR